MLLLEFIRYALPLSETGFKGEAFKVKWGHEDGPSLSEKQRKRH